MHLCYVDESGDTRPLDPADRNRVPVCVVAGVLIEQRKLHQLTNDFLLLKGKWFPNAVSSRHFLERVKTEIKGADLRRALRNGQSRNRRRHTIGFLDDFVDLLEAYQIGIVGRVWIKEINGPCDGSALYTFSIQAIASYFQHFLAARKSHGQIIADSRTPAHNAEVAHSIFTQKFKAPGDEYGRLLEMPTFGHSENHVGIQIADLVCSALIFPMATATYCLAHLPNNVHVNRGFLQLKGRYGSRLSQRQYRYVADGRRRGGLTVDDRIGRERGGLLFKP